MASIDDLKNVLKETLEQKGALQKIKSQIRAEIFTAMDADSQKGKPGPPDENVLINELIREYLEYNGYYNSASVFITESGQPVDPPFDRNYMERKLQIQSNVTANATFQSKMAKEQQVPLLYEITNGLQKNDTNTDFKFS